MKLTTAIIATVLSASASFAANIGRSASDTSQPFGLQIHFNSQVSIAELLTVTPIENPTGSTIYTVIGQSTGNAAFPFTYTPSKKTLTFPNGNGVTASLSTTSIPSNPDSKTNAVYPLYPFWFSHGTGTNNGHALTTLNGKVTFSGDNLAANGADSWAACLDTTLAGAFSGLHGVVNPASFYDIFWVGKAIGTGAKWTGQEIHLGSARKCTKVSLKKTVWQGLTKK